MGSQYGALVSREGYMCVTLNHRMSSLHEDIVLIVFVAVIAAEPGSRARLGANAVQRLDIPCALGPTSCIDMRRGVCVAVHGQA